MYVYCTCTGSSTAEGCGEEDLWTLWGKIINEWDTFGKKKLPTIKVQILIKKLIKKETFFRQGYCIIPSKWSQMLIKWYLAEINHVVIVNVNNIKYDQVVEKMPYCRM